MGFSQGRRGTPLYLPYRYVRPQKLWFLRRFDLKTGMEIAYFGLSSGKVFKGIRECVNVSVVWTTKWIRKRDRVICEFEMDFKKSFCWRSNLTDDNIISAYSKSEARSLENDKSLAWNRFRMWRTGRHTPSKNSQEYPSGMILSQGIV